MGNSATLPPGQYAVELPVSGSLKVTNTTPGRDAPDPLPLGSQDVDGLWKVPTPFCTSPNLDGTGPGIPPDAVHDLIAGTWYCIATTLATIQDNTQGDQFKPGQTVVSPLMPEGTCQSTQENAACLGPGSFPAHDDVFVYSQPEARAVLTALRTTPDVVLAYWAFGNRNSDDVCTDSTQSSGVFAWLISTAHSLPANTCG
jgi:hypothetical protein